MEPQFIEKRESTATKLRQGGQKTPLIPETPTIYEIKKQLKKIREYTRDNIDSLIQELQTNISQNYPRVRLKSASDSVEAIRYITEISDGINIVSVNNSSTVNQELKLGMISSGFTVVDSYLNEYEAKESAITDYWDLPRLIDKDLRGTFDVSIKMTGINQADIANKVTKRYLSILGINAISAEDSTVFFLQHFFNIYDDLKHAEKVILVVSVDKIVKDRLAAALLTTCMGIFGMESMLLNIKPRASGLSSITDYALPLTNRSRELHLILLKNRMSYLQQAKFRDLFLCIGCRACNKHCPINYFFDDMEYAWTPKNYLDRFIGRINNSMDTCLHCEACRLECPLDIDLPGLMWQAKIDHIKKHGRSLHHKILGMPELLAKLGTNFAPLANWLMGVKLIRILSEFITGIDRNTTLPKFHCQTFRKWFKNN
ncbi:4Fe-4S dicluster domain-containing protein [Chloroflexota bacterium]